MYVARLDVMLEYSLGDSDTFGTYAPIGASPTRRPATAEIFSRQKLFCGRFFQAEVVE